MSRVSVHPGARTCLGLLLVFLALSPTPSEGQTAGDPATVTGRVTDEYGATVPYVEVSAIQDARRIARTTTDGEGRYRLSIPPGPVRIGVDGGMGFTSSESDERSAPAGAALTVDLRVSRQIYDHEAMVVTTDGPGGGSTVSRAPGWVDLVDGEEIRSTVTVNPIDVIRDRPGVDLVDTGLGSRVLNFRGFNNIFSGALRYLVDYRKASLPSLRANFTHFVPTTGSDMERMELILGPSSALYGPNSADGVLNVLTRSPLDVSETTVALSSGSQSVREGEVRTSRRLGDHAGLKLSARWFHGEEYAYADPVEASIRSLIETDPEAFRADLRDIGIPDAEIARREPIVGVRDRDIERWSADARFDWVPFDGDTLILQAGRLSSTGIEVTPLGAAQADGWTNDYLQARLHAGSLFAQAYMNGSDAGSTWLLRDGGALIDRSRVVGAQLRHGFRIAGGRQEVTYGADASWTTPRTGGTIHGQFEDDDEITQYGGYIQSETRIADPLEFTATLRFDESNVIEDAVLSPRVGLVFEPEEGHTFNVSWSNGFSTPTPTNLFLDLSGGTAPGALGDLGYRVRARGTGRDGIRFGDGEGGFQGMRSPCTPPDLGGPSQLMPISPAFMWQCGVGILQAQGAIDPQTAAFLASLDPTGSVGVNVFDPVGQTVAPLTTGNVRDVEPLVETRTSTLEVGYRGLLGRRVFVQAAGWRTTKDNFTSPLLIRTPLLTLDGAQLGAFLASSGLPAEQAQALATGLAPIPLGVLSSSDIQGAGAEVIATYENYGQITYHGVDLGVLVDLSHSLTLSASGSWVSEDHFDIDGRLVPLNAPAFKGSLALGVDKLPLPVSGEVRVRHHAGFPVSSGDYVGMACLGVDGPLVQDCVDPATLVDARIGWEGIADSNVTVRLNVSNLFDRDYRPFVGVPTQGRRLMARVEYRLR